MVKHAHRRSGQGFQNGVSPEPAPLAALSRTFGDLILVEPFRSLLPNQRGENRLTNAMTCCTSLAKYLSEDCFLNAQVDPVAHRLLTVCPGGRGVRWGRSN